MGDFTEWFAHPFLLRGIAAAALAGFLAGFVGAWTVLRRMALIADALSHTLFPGLAVSLALVGLSATGLFLGGLLSAALVVIGAEFISRSSRLKRDASVAILYALSYALGSAILSRTGTRIHLEHWLFGHILNLEAEDLWLLWSACLIILPTLVALERPLALTLLTSDVARSMGVSTGILQSVLSGSLLIAALLSFKSAGVVPSVAMLVAPGACLRLCTDRLPVMLWGSASLGALGGVLGTLLSCALENTPPGACISLVLGSFFVFAFVFSPSEKRLNSRHPRFLFCEDSVREWPHPGPLATPITSRKNHPQA
jgi:ABC-type Mn2+/Zn2+ transport system permease subunit